MDLGGRLMRSRLTIMAMVVVLVLAALAILFGFVRWFGVGLGLLLGFGLASVAPTVHRTMRQPWQHRWGAKDEEGARTMPGDEILLEHHHLEVDDQILMVPGMGPRSRAIGPHRSLLCGDEEAGTWCLGLHPDGEHRTRLVSRWRIDWPLTPATAFWTLLSDPGVFVLERRMLLGMPKRVERATTAESGDRGSRKARGATSTLGAEGLTVKTGLERPSRPRR
jgi:hypothetical protein